MDKKKFYIILFSMVGVSLVGYLIIYLNGFSGDDHEIKPVVNDSGMKLQEKLNMKNNALPKLMSASGQVVSVDENLIKVELNMNDEKIIVEINPKEEGVELVSGSYNEDGGLEDRKVTQTTIDKLKEGDNISFRFEDFISVDELENETFQVNDIRINPQGNPEL